MALAFVASAVNTNDSAGTTLNASTTLNILAGDLIVAFGGLAVSSGAATIATVTGGTAITMTQGNYNYYSVFEYMGWKQFAASESGATFRLTTASDAANRSITVLQFRPSADSTIDIHAGFVPGNATGTSMATTAIDVIGDDIMTVAYAMVGNAATFSARNIDGIAADGTVAAGSRVSAWYRGLTASDTGITATGTLAASDEYIIELFAFRAVPKGTTLSSVRVQTATNDWLHIESAPAGGSLITMWGRVPAYTGGYPHQRGNATFLNAQGDDVSILGLICNGGANAANVGVQRYNNNVMVGSRTPRDGWAGDYCMIDKYDLRIPEENMLGGWNFYAVQYVLQASAILIRQWSKAGRGAEILFVESNPTFAALRTFLVSQGWTAGDAALFTPDDLVRIILGAYPGDSANFVYYDLTQIKIYARSTQPTFAEIDAISLNGTADTSAWADWSLRWASGSAVLTDQSGNGRTLLLNSGGTLYSGASFFDGVSTSEYTCTGEGSISFAGGSISRSITNIYKYRDAIIFNSQNINPEGYYGSTLLQGFFFDKVIQSGFTCTGSGEIDFAGQAVCSSAVLAYSFAGSGSITYSGFGRYLKTLSSIGVGSITYSGSGINRETISFAGSGNIAYLGNGAYQETLSSIGSGNIIYSGVADCSSGVSFYKFTGSGNISYAGLATYSLSLAYSGSGNIAYSGNGAYRETLSQVGSGSILYSGNGISVETISQSGSGNIVYSGNGSYRETLSQLGIGNIYYSGSCTTTVSLSCSGSGEIDFSGEAYCNNGGNKFTYVGVGIIEFLGDCEYQVSITTIGSGNIAFAGSAYPLVTLYSEGTGEVLWSGFATCSKSGDNLIFVVHLYNGLELAAHAIPEGNDLQMKVGASQIGIPLITVTDTRAGAIRIKHGSTTYALRQS